MKNGLDTTIELNCDFFVNDEKKGNLVIRTNTKKEHLDFAVMHSIKCLGELTQEDLRSENGHIKKRKN